MLDVYFYEAFEEEKAALSRHLPPHIDAGFTWKTIQEEKAALPPARVISFRTQSCIPTEWVGTLSGILSRSTGYDHIKNLLAGMASPPLCGYLPLYCSRAVAEQALLLWMALLRKLFLQTSQFHRFHRDGLTGVECAGKILVVVGVGNIGSEVARIGQGMGMKVLGVDIVERHSFITYAPPEDAIPQADIIVCAMNLTRENRAYFHYDRLKKARAGVLFVNIARGELSPCEDLLRLLEEGHLGGLALDVYSRESDLAILLRTGGDANDNEITATLGLARHPAAVLTPHNAFNTEEAVERKAEQSIQQIEHFLTHHQFLWPIP